MRMRLRPALGVGRGVGATGCCTPERSQEACRATTREGMLAAAVRVALSAATMKVEARIAIDFAGRCSGT